MSFPYRWQRRMVYRTVDLSNCLVRLSLEKALYWQREKKEEGGRDIQVSGRIQYEPWTGMLIYSMSPVYKLEFAKPE